MNEQQLSPDDRVTQNELICEKLLGWIKRPSNIPGISFSGWCVPNGPDEPTPSFTTWAEAGLILDAFTTAKIEWDVNTTLIDGFSAKVILWFRSNRLEADWNDTGPLAIRSAALEYIKATDLTAWRSIFEKGAIV